LLGSCAGAEEQLQILLDVVNLPVADGPRYPLVVSVGIQPYFLVSQGRNAMKFMLMIYNDPTLLDALPAAQADGMMRDCLAHADELRQEGHLIESQMLEGTGTAKSVRIRNGRPKVTEGPFSEAKEVLGGFNLIEARDMDHAIEIAAQFPWAATGCVEVRPVRDIGDVRRRVNAGRRNSPEEAGRGRTPD